MAYMRYATGENEKKTPLKKSIFSSIFFRKKIVEKMCFLWHQ